MRKYSSPLINELNEEIMNKEIFESLDRIDDALLNIDVKVKAIHEKLDELIKALHEYDDDLSTFEDEPQQGVCSKHDEASWDEERMDIIGQNGNEGIHYVTNEEADEDAFSDYGMRIAKKVMSDKDNVRVGKDKSNNTQPKQKQYWKNNRSKRSENKK
jgi:Ca2+-dependent lipid-binding protein